MAQSHEDYSIEEKQMTPLQGLYSAFWCWQYRTRMSITRPLRIALMRRKMRRQKRGLIIPKRTEL